MKKLPILFVISSLALSYSGLFADVAPVMGPKTRAETREEWKANNPQKAAKWEAKKTEKMQKMQQKLQKFMATVNAVIANSETPADLKSKLEDLKKHLEEKKQAIESGNWEGMMKKMRDNRQDRVQKMKDLRNEVKKAKETEGISEGLKQQLKELDKELEHAQNKMEKRGKHMQKRGERMMKRGERMQERGRN